MCGIAGVIMVRDAREPAGAAPLARITPAWISDLDEAIAHRGPDGRGVFEDRVVLGDIAVSVVLVHRRLSIIDHAGGAQPMTIRRHGGERVGDDPAALSLVFNGCVYNHRELRRELVGLGEQFESDHSDTEALLRGWGVWGEGVLQKVEAMLAAGVWDARAGRLTLARDLAGEKPLYWTWLPDEASRGRGLGTGVFASTARGVARWMARARPEGVRACPHAVATWLSAGFGDRLPLVGLEEVPPGSIVTLGEGNRPQVRRVLQVPGRGSRGVAGVEELDAAIARAVARRVEADVPLGCFLSGGVDSSLVAWHAKAALGTLRTLTVRMPDSGVDESAFAAKAARIIGSRHEVIDCGGDPAADLLGLIQSLGLPLGDSSLLPTYWVSRAARDRVGVALGGDGGDELFAGYERHRAARWLARWGPIFAMLPSQWSTRSDRTSRWTRLARLGEAARRGWVAVHELWRPGVFARLGLRTHGIEGVPWGRADGSLPSWVGSSWAGPTWAGSAGAGRRGDGDCGVEDGPRWDFEHTLPEDLLRKVDTASMAVPIEVRSPLLDRELVGMGLGMPIEGLMPRGRRKGLLRAVARRHFPASLIDRPKQGFAVPISAWLREGSLRGLAEERLLGGGPKGWDALGIEIDPVGVEGIWREHLEGGADHGPGLFALVALAVWAGSCGRA